MNRASELLWPLLFILCVAFLTAAFLFAGPLLPNQVNALLTALGVSVLLATWVHTKSPQLRFWEIRMRARLGAKISPAWRLRVGYRARVGPTDATVFESLVQRRFPGARVHFDSERFASLEVDGIRATIEWVAVIEQPERDLSDWEILVQSDHASVAYHESLRYLRQTLMPVLEAIEDGLEVVERSYHLVVEYKTGWNPFEGMVVRTAPGTTVASYQVVLRPSPDETITLARDSLHLDAASRSRFEDAVERLLMLSGAWGGGSAT